MRFGAAFCLLLCLLLAVLANELEFSGLATRLPGQPIQFITLDLVGGILDIRLTDEGRALLESLPPDQPPALVAVVGRNSRGKSYLLNQLLDRLPGDTAFPVSDAPTSTTRGVMAWSPAPCIGADGLVPPAACLPGDRRLILWDTQGLQAPDFVSVALDQTIFSMALLSGSVLIYNMERKIDADNLLELSGVVALSEIVDAGADAGLVGFPSLVWTIQIAQETQLGDQTEYLLGLLNTYATSDDMPQNRRIAETLRRFPAHHALGMPAPVENWRLWPRLPKLPPSQLAPAYRSAVAQLRRRVVDAARASPTTSRSANGQTLLNLLTAFINVLHDHPVPEPGHLADEVRRAAVDDAVTAFAAAADARTGACRALAAAARAATGGGPVTADTATYLVEAAAQAGNPACLPLTAAEAEAAAADIVRIAADSAAFFADPKELESRMTDLRTRFVDENRIASDVVCGAALAAARAAVAAAADADGHGQTAVVRSALVSYRAARQGAVGRFRERCRGPALALASLDLQAAAERREQAIAGGALRNAAVCTVVVFVGIGIFYTILGRALHTTSVLVSTISNGLLLVLFANVLAFVLFSLSIFTNSTLGTRLILLFSRIYADELAGSAFTAGAAAVVFFTAYAITADARRPEPGSRLSERSGLPSYAVDEGSGAAAAAAKAAELPAADTTLDTNGTLLLSQPERSLPPLPPRTPVAPSPWAGRRVPMEASSFMESGRDQTLPDLQAWQSSR